MAGKATRDALNRLFDAADDDELQTLEDIMVRAGLVWVCPVEPWTNYVNDRCGECGRTKTEAHKEIG